MTTNHNKLVRDKIPQIIANNNKIPITRIATEKEYEECLLQKLKEEMKEFEENYDIEELADIIEVIDVLKNTNKYIEVDEIRKQKRQQRGGFEKRIILERVEDK